jgi:hypothetical protein
MYLDLLNHPSFSLQQWQLASVQSLNVSFLLVVLGVNAKQQILKLKHPLFKLGYIV